jgi:hypothetical protein
MRTTVTTKREEPSERPSPRFHLLSRGEAEMWVSLMGRREAERYYPGILALIRQHGNGSKNV